MKMTNQICLVGVFPKTDDFFKVNGPKSAKRYFVTSDQFTIGSAADADVAIKGKGIGPHHLEVSIKNSELWFENKDPSLATVVTGNPIPSDGPFSYKPGEIVQLGQAEILLTVEIFTRNFDAKPEADAIFKEVQDKVHGEEQHLEKMKREAHSAIDQAKNDASALVNKAKQESEHLLSEAHRQIEEKNRKAVEEGHLQAEALIQKAKSQVEGKVKESIEQSQNILNQKEEEAQKIIKRAEAVASDLVTSAKKEVDILLKQANGQAGDIEKEGLEKKKAVIKETEDLKKDISKLSDERETLRTQTSQAKITCNEILHKQESLSAQAEEIEEQFNKSQSKHNSLLTEIKKAEEKCAAIEDQTNKSLQIQRDAEKATADLKNEALEFEKRITTLTQQKDEILDEIKELDSKKGEATKTLEGLNQKYQSGLIDLRKKIDAEYQRQLKESQAYFEQLRERENVYHQKRQRSLEKLEGRRFRKQIDQVNDRLWQLLCDRGELFGIGKLAENQDFKKDMARLTETAMTEEFDLRRREVLSTLHELKSIGKGKRVRGRVTQYAGWALSLGLLAVYLYSVYGQSWLNPIPPRQPASVNQKNWFKK